MASVPSGPVDPDAILRQPFTTVRRGYDPLEVQTYLMAIAGELRAARDRQRDLEQDLDELRRRLAAAEAEPTRAELTALLGAEMTKVLDAANAAAADIAARAEQDAAAVRAEADAVLGRKVREAEEAAAEVRRQVDGVLEQARQDAEVEVEAGRAKGRELVEEARAVRSRLLDDLVDRRRRLREQIEQLQAGRARLLEAYGVLRQHVDDVTAELDAALPEAKLAAEAVALAFVEETGDPELDAELAALAAADAAGDGDGEETGEDDAAEAPAGDEAPTAAGPRAPDPAPGRHSSAVNVIRTGEHAALPAEPAATPPAAPAPAEGSRAMVAGLFARITADASDDPERPPAGAAAFIGTAEPGADRDEAIDLAELEEEQADPALVALGDFARTLTRRLKRAVADEQNEVLDTIRRSTGARGGGVPDLDALVPAVEDHVARYAAAALPALAGAAAAGAEQQADPDAAGSPAVGVGDLAEELAAGLVAAVRTEVTAALDDARAAGGETEDVLDLVGTAYRELRAHEVDGPAGAAVQQAFERAAAERV